MQCAKRRRVEQRVEQRSGADERTVVALCTLLQHAPILPADVTMSLRCVNRQLARAQQRPCSLVLSRKQSRALYARRRDDARYTALLSLVYSLDLSDCAEVVDVSALGRVHSLNLTYCKYVVDVSALGRVHSLNLSYCTGVVDVSALGGVHSLDLWGCTRVVDVSALGSVHSLDLTGCTRVVDVSALGRVYSLNLEGCTNIIS